MSLGLLITLITAVQSTDLLKALLGHTVHYSSCYDSAKLSSLALNI